LINHQRLEEAARFRTALEEIHSDTGDFVRLRRGLNVLFDGLRQDQGEERLHQFVRALEALILPDIGDTKRQFVHRSQTFAKPCERSKTILAEAFDLRSKAEHVNDWESALGSYDSAQREYVAFQRTWQMEKLVRFAYARIMTDKHVRAQFRNDTAISSFWKQNNERARLKIWGKQLTL
jgi:hypothetical protein